MCFTSKSQKANFSDLTDGKKANGTKANGTKANGAKPHDKTNGSSPTAASSASTRSKAESSKKASPKVAIVIYTVYGHIAKSKPYLVFMSWFVLDAIPVVAEAVKEGIVQEGGNVTIFQCVCCPQNDTPSDPCYRVPETLSPEILAMIHAPAKPDYPIFTLEEFVKYDAFLFGIPTRYGTMPAQWKVISQSNVFLISG